ncbi:class I SAM-dependent methyltransferase [Actinocorallia sp. API 0066]|uniref:class I SAM-dependent methyltransferase n=1 Tax=Actinocorallia sp. API 0066 TaxID=2896846 RepID=UPI001E4998B0|nr:class I SAM-dependent methyltransferase [Actinocorallia sp. API 0066]MCD0449068.1 class I SAM-dependent methyltransferase [Actinocorallia sp. API 0066]
MLHDVSSEVAEHYTRFPFPLPDAAHPSSGMEAIGGLIRFHGLDPSGWRVLDAGCGTGNRLLGLAGEFPDAHVTGIDLAPGALDLARHYLAETGVTNATVRQGDLGTAPLDGPYDLIWCCGVLHHIPDPLPALANLRSALADTGLLILWLYNSIGTMNESLQRELVLTLGRDLPPDRRLDLAKRVCPSLNEDWYIDERHDFGDISPAAYDSILADALLTPYVREYRLAEMLDLLRQGGWRHVQLAGMSVPDRALTSFEIDGVDGLPVFDIGDHTTDGTVAELYRELPLEPRWRAAELVTRPTGLLLLAWAPGAYDRLSPEHRRRVRTLDRPRETIGKATPC